MEHQSSRTAVWALTPKGAALIPKISEAFPDAATYLSASLEGIEFEHTSFESLAAAVAQDFRNYDSHIFIMAVGIVVRVIAPHIRSKMRDPAVVVADERGNYAISLLSGHIGGANALAKRVAECLHAMPVITTATDVNNLPSVDLLALERNLFIENPNALKKIHLAVLTGKKMAIHDPFNLMSDVLSELNAFRWDISEALAENTPAIFIDDTDIAPLPDMTNPLLILRPRSLVAGIGCNRNTETSEMEDLLFGVLEDFSLSPKSLTNLASIDIKKDEPGLISLAEKLKIPVKFFSKAELNEVKDIQTPSETVEKHIGVKSVCEASAILGAKPGKLIVPKRSSRNATVAIARKNFIL